MSNSIENEMRSVNGSPFSNGGKSPKGLQVNISFDYCLAPRTIMHLSTWQA